MLNLIGWEIKKIFKRRSAQAALLLTVLFTLLVAGTKVVYDLSYKPDEETGRIWGYKQITAEYAMADPWRGPLTEERLQAARREFLKAFAPENLQPGGYAATAAWETYAHPVNGIVDMTRSLLIPLGSYTSYAEMIQRIEALPDETIATFYAARDRAVEERLREKLDDEGDIQFFLAQNAQVETPFYYDYYRGQDAFAESLSFVINMVGTMLCIALAPIFAGEYQSGMAAVALCTKRGRGRLGIAKLAAALLLALADFALCLGTYLAVQFIFLGTRGLDCPIQLVSLNAAAPLTLGQAEAYALLLGLLGVLAAAGMTLAFSARMQSPFPVIVAVLGLLLLLPLFSGVFPEIGGIGKLLALLPMTKGYSTLWGYELYHFFGRRIWAPAVVLAAQPAILAVCLPLAHRAYTRHQVR